MKIKFVLFISLLLVTNFCYALDIPARPEHYVNDYTGILARSQEANLNSELRSYENTSSNQVVVAIFNSLERENLEDFSIRLAEKWKVGQKGKDNGVILLIFMKEHKIRIEVGYGLEDKLTDALSRLIISNNIAPYFKKGDYYSGIKEAVTSIIGVTSGKFKASHFKKRKSSGSLFGTIFRVIIGLVILYFFIKNPFAFFLFSTGLSGRGSYSGGGGFSGFGGGFSSGGGSFGGGGASGGW